MEVTTTSTERARVEIPHDLFVRFLKSLGAEIPEDARLHVHQPSGAFSKDNPDVYVSWTMGEHESKREVNLMDDEDIQIVAGLRDLDRKSTLQDIGGPDPGRYSYHKDDEEIPF